MKRKTLKPRPDVERLLKLARRRGAVVHVLPSTKMPLRAGHKHRKMWHEAPFTHLDLVINDRSRALFMDEHGLTDDEAAGSLIHELAHLHAVEGEDIEDANEWRWLGWELSIAREANVMRSWSKAMKSYQIGEIGELTNPVQDLDIHDTWDPLSTWGSLSSTYRRRVAKDRICHAIETGIVSDRGVAIWSNLPKAKVHV